MRPAPRSSFHRLVPLAAILLSACGHGGGEGAAPPPPREVTTTVVKKQDVPVAWEYIAQAKSSQQVSIRARVNGFLDRCVYTEGSTVKAGDVLFQMDQKPFQVQLDAAEAALARQKANLAVAKSNLARTRPLTAASALSQKDLDDATGAFEVAQASVAQAEAAVAEARLNLSYTTITSPIDGITGQAIIADGTYVNFQTDELTTVAVLTPMWVNFSVSENEFQSIRDQVTRGLLRTPDSGEYSVDIVLVDGSLFPGKGRITFRAYEYDAKTGMFLVRVSVDNPTGLLRPNQFVRVRLNGAVRPKAVMVPQRAVQQGAKGHFVWLLGKDSKVAARPVMVGDPLGDNWFIYDGLAEGDVVVVDGALALRPGEEVRVKPAASAPAGAPAPAAAAPAAAK